jgi:NAD(P)-dependent dehydrogenase (short-subunit alcohol dehydrogenase family)
MRGEKDLHKLEGKIALITGGNSGIGLATAKQCVHEGAYVCITGRREPELAAVKEIGSHVTGVQGDVVNLGDLDRLFTHIQREKGKLDSVFANADVATSAPFGEITEEHYDAIFNVHVSGEEASKPLWRHPLAAPPSAPAGAARSTAQRGLSRPGHASAGAGRGQPHGLSGAQASARAVVEG